MPSFVECRNVTKTYHVGEVTIPAANGIDFSIEKGEFVVIVGPSGAGKTTVLNILGGMDRPTSGEILVDGTDIATLSHKQLIAYRRNDIGFVFQFYNLVQNLTALENVELALQICKDPLPADQVLRDVGLGDRLEAPALRRADRCTGLYDRQSDSEAPAGHLPLPEDDHYRNHA